VLPLAEYKAGQVRLAVSPRAEARLPRALRTSSWRSKLALGPSVQTGARGGGTFSSVGSTAMRRKVAQQHSGALRIVGLPRCSNPQPSRADSDLDFIDPAVN
jgi:hypothetical protein